MITRSSLDKSQPTTRDIRKANRLQILHQLLLRKNCSRLELSQRTGLSSATVANLIADLMLEGLVIEVGMEASQGGRPIAILAINKSVGVCVGIDVAETYLRFDLYNLVLENLGEYQIDLPSSKKEPREIVRLIEAGFDELLKTFRCPKTKVVGVGISIPGPFEHSTGVSVFAPSWGWVNVNLKAILEEEMDIPLYMDNPLKFNTVAEAWFGAGLQVDTMVAVVLGTGVGAGIVINGELFHGASNTAGEWGHSVIMAGGRPCRCGSRGCLEAYIGAPGILQTLKEIDPESSFLILNDQTRSISEIASAAQKGDSVALEVVKKTAFFLSAGLSSLINVINPELVIIGSWVAKLLGPVLMAETIQLIQQQSLTQPFNAARFVLSDMSRNPVTLGAATLVLEEFLVNSDRQPAFAHIEDTIPA